MRKRSGRNRGKGGGGGGGGLGEEGGGEEEEEGQNMGGKKEFEYWHRKELNRLA